MLNLITAVSKNNIIGKGNELPWHINSDLRYFNRITKGHAVILGRKTYFSIPNNYRPLKKRLNIVLTRQSNLKIDNKVKTVNTISKALKLIPKEKQGFVAGGRSIYKQFLNQNLIERMYITKVDATVDGDYTFPEVNWSRWKLISKTINKKTKRDSYDCTFLIYEKK